MTAVVKRDEPQVPALANTPALEITADDIAIPRLYIGQFMSSAVQNQLVKAGSIYSAQGQDDPDPQVLWEPPADPKKNPGVQFHVLSLRKGKSISEGGELLLFDYNDPNAPEDAWTTYNYVVALPDVDDELPYKLLLTRTGRPAAMQINTVLRKNAIGGPAWNTAFRLTTAARENAKGKYFVARVQAVEPSAEAVSSAEALGLMIAAAPVVDSSAKRGDEPAI